MATNSTINLSPPPTTSPPSLIPTTTILLLLSTYLLAVHLLRFSRRDSMISTLGYTTRESLQSMTNTDAQRIMKYIGELEFPTIHMKSLQFALFKTYGIPTISKLLVDTKQFSSKENASRRYADTTILISEFASHHPRHPRVLKAISRMNYLHSSYQKAGKISNGDLLYTLSVFINEPIAWINKYEWRKLDDMEICAFSTFWKGIGDAMGIEYHELSHWNAQTGKGEWKDGLEFYEDLQTWAEEYERQFMVPNGYNKKTANELVPMLLFYVPKGLQPFAREAVGALMGPLLRKAMMYPDPSASNERITSWILIARKYFLRHFALPRGEWMRVREISDSDDQGTNGRFHSKGYLVHPFYQKPDFWSRWGPQALLVRLAGGFVPDEKMVSWKPQGYKFEEVGPERRENQGLEEMKEGIEKLEMERTAGCPFAFGR